VKTLLKIMPCCFLALFVAEIIAVLVPKPGSEFGRLPVLLNGRVQPFDSVARNSLLQSAVPATCHSNKCHRGNSGIIRRS